MSMGWTLILILLLIFTVAAVAGILYFAAITPWTLATIDRDLVVMLLLWFAAVLFSGVTGKIHFPMGPDVSLSRLLWILLSLAFFSQIALQKRRLLPLTKIEIAMLVFAFIAAASNQYAKSRYPEIVLTGNTKLLNGFIFPFSLFFFSKHLVDDAEKIKKVFLFFLLVGLYLSLTAICEHFRPLWIFVYPKFILDPTVGIHWGRSRGPFVQAAVNGTVLAMLGIMALYLYLTEFKRSRKNLLMALAGILPVGLYFTLTRACWLGYVLGAGILAYFYPKFRQLLLIGMVLGVMALLIKSSATTGSSEVSARFNEVSPIYNRIYLYDTAKRMIFDRPILGFGFNSFEYASPKYFHVIKGVPYSIGLGLIMHDTFVGLLVEVGLVGLLPLLLMYIFIFQYSMRLYRRSAGEQHIRALLVVFWGVSAAFLTNMFFIDMRFFAFPNAIFFTLAGMMAGIHQRASVR